MTERERERGSAFLTVISFLFIVPGTEVYNSRLLSLSPLSASVSPSWLPGWPPRSLTSNAIVSSYLFLHESREDSLLIASDW